MLPRCVIFLNIPLLLWTKYFMIFSSNIWGKHSVTIRLLFKLLWFADRMTTNKRWHNDNFTTLLYTTSTTKYAILIYLSIPIWYETLKVLRNRQTLIKHKHPNENHYGKSRWELRTILIIQWSLNSFSIRSCSRFIRKIFALSVTEISSYEKHSRTKHIPDGIPTKWLMCNSSSGLIH